MIGAIGLAVASPIFVQANAVSALEPLVGITFVVVVLLAVGDDLGHDQDQAKIAKEIKKYPRPCHDVAEKDKAKVKESIQLSVSVLGSSVKY